MCGSAKKTDNINQPEMGLVARVFKTNWHSSTCFMFHVVLCGQAIVVGLYQRNKMLNKLDLPGLLTFILNIKHT